MSVAEVLERCGGVATRKSLVLATSRLEVDRALAAGEIIRVAQGRYASPDVEEALRAAHRLGGHLSHETAALHHGWAVQHPPEQPHVTVPRGRQLGETARDGVNLHRVTLGADDIDGVATARSRTLMDCLRSLPFEAALAVADSALREGFRPQQLAALARDSRGPGARQVRRVAAAADARAANPFESVLRAHALAIPGLEVVPQVSIREPAFLGRPDLVDERLRIVLEADSFEWHGDRAALARDARRYNRLVVAGWLVLRFSWEQVMFEGDEVRATLLAVVELRTEQAKFDGRAA